jgi:alanyl-tRNA synthetase
MSTDEVRGKYLDFFKSKGHAIIPSVSLVPKDDPTTLFTGSGMQSLLPYLLGEPHPKGTRIANSQKCFRAVDIEEVGDNRHTTIFEMLGNWSLGDYFKKEQLRWIWKFFIEELGLDPKRMYASAFSGFEKIPKDEETVDILKGIFNSYGIEARAVDNADKKGMQNGRIFYYGAKENWWSRVGVPENMPVGEPGGPTSEVFFDFGADREIHENSSYKNQPCHPTCDCGRFLEIGNSVFMTYEKLSDGSLKELPSKNIDFGGGLERILAALENTPDIFLIDSLKSVIQVVEKTSDKKYEGENKTHMRIIADHLRGATFLISDGVLPSNKDQGYFLRRLLRRAATSFYSLTGKLAPVDEIQSVANRVIDFYGDLYFDIKKDPVISRNIIKEEMEKFNKALERGIKKVKKAEPKAIDGNFAFDLYQSYGLPFEVTKEILAKRGFSVSQKMFDGAYERHKEISRKGIEKKFKGGLADHSDKTIKLHTATHLLHQALRDVLGEEVKQKGSNITKDRLRFDFLYSNAISDGQKKKIEDIVNSKIEENLDVWSETLDKDKAQKLGALAFFGEKYPDKVKVYFIGKKGDLKSAYSKEFCGGPHVKKTGPLGKFNIEKEKSAGSGVRRIYAILI